MTQLFMYDEFPVLETKRLLLREITPHDVDGIIALFGDVETVKYLHDLEIPVQTHQEAMEIIDWCADIFRESKGLRWGITLKGDDKLIGTCGYNYWLHGHRRAEVGYDLARPYWRQGIMSEAVCAILEFGFEHMMLYRIEADVTVGNEASAALLKSLNFQHEGTWRHRVFGRKQFWDLWQFGLLKSDYVEEPK